MALQQYTNKEGISLEMAVWLLFDEYDHLDIENYISATKLMKPVRQIVLPPRIGAEQQEEPDVVDLIPSSLGTAIHDSIEKAWKNGNHRLPLLRLGYPAHIVDRIWINPTPEELESAVDPVPVYIEQRTLKEIAGWTVGGKFDMVLEGRVTDTKSTSVWTWMYLDEEKKNTYRLQGSIYRWLNPDKITEDFMRINFVFTDWQKLDAKVKAEKGYPQRRIAHLDIPLMSYQETEEWILRKLKSIEENQDKDERLIPLCTDKELWLTPAKYKYYMNGDTSGRSTKNFDEYGEAQRFQLSKGGKGVIVTVPGIAKRCGYCAAYPICSQKDSLTTE